MGNKRTSEKLVERLETMDLVEESFVGGHPKLQLRIVSQAIEPPLR